MGLAGLGSCCGLAGLMLRLGWAHAAAWLAWLGLAHAATSQAVLSISPVTQHMGCTSIY